MRSPCSPTRSPRCFRASRGGSRPCRCAPERCRTRLGPDRSGPRRRTAPTLRRRTLAPLHVAATEIQQPEPDEQARHQRALSERSRQRDRAFGERDGVLPLADPGRVLDLYFRRPHAEERRASSSAMRCASARCRRASSAFPVRPPSIANAQCADHATPRFFLPSIPRARSRARRSRAPDRPGRSTGRGAAARDEREPTVPARPSSSRSPAADSISRAASSVRPSACRQLALAMSTRASSGRSPARRAASIAAS